MNYPPSDEDLLHLLCKARRPSDFVFIETHLRLRASQDMPYERLALNLVCAAEDGFGVVFEQIRRSMLDNLNANGGIPPRRRSRAARRQAS